MIGTDDMKRRIGRMLVSLAALLVLLILPAAAQTAGELYDEQLEASGAQELWDKLPEETRRLLDKLGITGLDEDFLSGMTPDGLLNSLLSLLSEEAGGPLRALAVLLGIILLCALLDGMKEAVKEPALSEVFQVISTLAACVAVLVPVTGCIRRVCEAASSTSVFMTSYVPVYAGLLLTGGQAATAVSFQTVVLFAAELISLLATQVIVPLTTVSLALGMTGSVTSGLKLDAVGGFINKISVWLLGLAATLFAGLLGLQSLVGSAADTLGGRAVKFGLSSFVPVVGGALSEAFTTIRGCLGLLKTTLGAFGMLATALIVLPPLLECALWMLCLSLGGMAAELFGLKTMGGLLGAVKSAMGTLIGVLACCGLFLIIATSIVTMTGRG